MSVLRCSVLYLCAAACTRPVWVAQAKRDAAAGRHGHAALAYERAIERELDGAARETARAQMQRELELHAQDGVARLAQRPAAERLGGLSYIARTASSRHVPRTTYQPALDQARRDWLAEQANAALAGARSSTLDDAFARLDGLDDLARTWRMPIAEVRRARDTAAASLIRRELAVARGRLDAGQPEAAMARAYALQAAAATWRVNEVDQELTRLLDDSATAALKGLEDKITPTGAYAALSHAIAVVNGLSRSHPLRRRVAVARDRAAQYHTQRVAEAGDMWGVALLHGKLASFHGGNAPTADATLAARNLVALDTTVSPGAGPCATLATTAASSLPRDPGLACSVSVAWTSCSTEDRRFETEGVATRSVASTCTRTLPTTSHQVCTQNSDVVGGFVDGRAQMVPGKRTCHTETTGGGTETYSCMKSESYPITISHHAYGLDATAEATLVCGSFAQRVPFSFREHYDDTGGDKVTLAGVNANAARTLVGAVQTGLGAVQSQRASRFIQEAEQFRAAGQSQAAEHAFVQASLLGPLAPAAVTWFQQQEGLSASAADALLRGGELGGVSLTSESPTLPTKSTPPTVPSASDSLQRELDLPSLDPFLVGMDDILVFRKKPRLQGSEAMFQPGVDVAFHQVKSHLDGDSKADALEVTLRGLGPGHAMSLTGSVETRLLGQEGSGFGIILGVLGGGAKRSPGLHVGGVFGYTRHQLSTDVFGKNGIYDSNFFTGIQVVRGFTKGLALDVQFRPNWLRLLGHEPPMEFHFTPLAVGLSYDFGRVVVRGELVKYLGADPFVVPGLSVGARL